jgi:hypothetical protein
MAASHLYSVRDHSPVHILLQKVWVRMVSGKNKSTNNVQKKEGFEVHTGLLFFDRYHRYLPANIIKYMHISHISSCLLDIVVLSLMVKSAWRHHYLGNPTWKYSILFLNVPCTGWVLAIWVVPWQFSRLPNQTHGLDWRKNASSLTNLRGAFDTRPSHTSCVANRNR